MSAVQTTHHVWCDPTRCTAEAGPDAVVAAEHRSSPVVVAPSDFGFVAFSLWLAQPVDEPEAVAIDIEVDDTERRFVYRLGSAQANVLRHEFERATVDMARTELRTWNSVDHPYWCDHDRCVTAWDSHRFAFIAFEHMSRPAVCNLDGADDVSVSVYLWQAAVMSDLTVARLEFSLPHDLQAFPVPPDQAAELRDALKIAG